MKNTKGGEYKKIVLCLNIKHIAYIYIYIKSDQNESKTTWIGGVLPSAITLAIKAIMSFPSESI